MLRTQLGLSGWVVRHVVLLASLGLFMGCGDDDGAPDTNPADTGSPDTSDDADVLMMFDADPPAPDVGPPPGCRGAATVLTFAPGFDNEADQDPLAFAAASPTGPFAFAYLHVTGDGATRESRLEVRVADATEEIALASLEEVRGSEGRIQHVKLAGTGAGYFVTWSRAELDGAMLESTEVRYAGVASDGAVLRAPARLYPNATAPHVGVLGDDIWMLRSDVRFAGEVAVVSPMVQRLDLVGDPTGPSVDFSSLIRVEATDIHLAPTGEDVKLVYAVAPSTVVTIPLTLMGGPSNLEQNARDVASADSVVAEPDLVGVGWSRPLGADQEVGVALLNGRGTRQERVSLETFESNVPTHAAIVRAWPGFSVFWIQGAGDDAVIRGAGVADNGAIVVPPVDVAEVPGALGELFAHTDGETVHLGFRVKTAEANELAIVRACIPEPAP